MTRHGNNGRPLVETAFTRLPDDVRATIAEIRRNAEGLEVSQYWADVDPERVAERLHDLHVACARLLVQMLATEDL